MRRTNAFPRVTMRALAKRSPDATLSAVAQEALQELERMVRAKAVAPKRYDGSEESPARATSTDGSQPTESN
jgi:hypothetical protein